MKENPLLKTKWVHSFKNKHSIEKAGFNYNFYYDGYIYKFPVAVYDNNSTLECLLVIPKDPDDSTKVMKQVQIEVVGTGTFEYYAPFYTYNKPYENFIDDINKQIKIKLDMLKIHKKNKKKHKPKKKVEKIVKFKRGKS